MVLPSRVFYEDLLCVFLLPIPATFSTQVILLDLTIRWIFNDEYHSSNCPLCNSTKTYLLLLSKCEEWFELFSVKYMYYHYLYAKRSAWAPKRSMLLHESFRVKIQYQHLHVSDCQLLHCCESLNIRSWLQWETLQYLGIFQCPNKNKCLYHKTRHCAIKTCSITPQV